jgi:methylated-DNA-[protein]-cysteine S-methyltransferase
MNMSNPTGLHVMTIPSPIGELSLYSDGSRLLRIGFPEQVTELAERRDDPILMACARQLKEYFDGTRRHFDLPLEPRGTEFQLRVWEALTQIPYGQTRSYRDIALAIGKPTAVRAVGAANGRNPLPIVVPCHRVIGSDGSLTGFAGGLEAKTRLLQLEGSLI